MEIASKYTKVFVSDDLTRQKYDELYDLAVSIREQKNTISILHAKCTTLNLLFIHAERIIACFAAQ